MSSYKLCAWCKHFEVSSSFPGYSEYTPGSPGGIVCHAGCFDYNLDDFDLNEADFRKLLLRAKTCNRYVAAEEE